MRRTIFSVAASVVVFLWSPATVHAATIFFDDFEDGDHLDGSPVSWDVAGPDPDDEEIIVDGSLVLTSGGINGGYNYAGVSGYLLTNASIRAQVKGGPNDSIGLSARVDVGNVDSDSYWGRIDSAGEVRVNGADVVPTDLRLELEDVVLQFDVFDNQLSLWAWRPNEDMPDDPLVANSLDTLTSGATGVWVCNWPWSNHPVEGIFRYVHVADVHIHPGDFDNDGDVDGDDFLTWQQGYGMQSGAAPANGDADYDGDVDGDDFLVWQREFGTGSRTAGAAVPEPASVLVLLAAAAGVCLFPIPSIAGRRR